MAVAMGAVFQVETRGNQSGRQKPVQLHKGKGTESLHELCGQGLPCVANHHARCTRGWCGCRLWGWQNGLLVGRAWSWGCGKDQRGKNSCPLLRLEGDVGKLRGGWDVSRGACKKWVCG